MKKHLLISTLLAGLVILAGPSCSRVMEEDMPERQGLPEGTPITMRLDFGFEDLMNVDVSTKAEASGADEERIHDLYVFIFCNGEGEDHPHPDQKIYGRYFSYEHLQPDLATLDSSPNEGWFVENRTLDNVTKPISKTPGAVKISTRVCTSARIVVIANVDNGICKVGDQEDVLDYLNNIWSYDELEQTRVKLTQDIVNRKDLFLMLGVMENGSGDPKIDTGSMVWHTDAGSSSLENHSDTRYQVKLNPVDAKVKFKVRINDPAITAEHGEYISAAKAVYWQVCNAPDHCYLFSDYAPDDALPGTYPAPDETVYFDTEPAYFEGTVTDDGEEWYVFSFYMLESRFAALAHADEYHKREKQVKTNTDKTGYGGADSEYYVENGEWIYADPYAAYVKFDMILTLTPAGIEALGGSVRHALTSDTIYTVHLGDFSNVEDLGAYRFDDYNTYRSTCYTYEITIANAGTIYAEVKNDNERQPGQEGYLLLTDDEIVNADAHYEYHAITFYYDPETTPDKFSWYVKTPFTDKVGGGPIKGTKRVDDVDYPVYDPHAEDGTLLDYRWVKFGINEVVAGKYSTNRVAYPGDDAYDEDWGVGDDGPWNSPHPELMDISQLIQYIFEETKKENATPYSSDFLYDAEEGQKVIRATIFIDEYYYTVDPRDESEHPQPDPNLWRQFVNAQPREMHILSRTVQSRDRKSDVIESSHSVIQQSIQTIYNIYEPSLRSIWGAEHLDEIKYTTVDGKPQSDPAGNWTYWPSGCPESERAGKNDDIGKENGRLNSAYIWGLYSSQGNGGTFDEEKLWNTYLHYEVDNRVPEVNNEYKGMAWSCLTRNRDNNGNHKIDRDEVRWYMAASQQLAGLWVGSESLSTTARLYQPVEGQWRSHVVSSTDKKVAWAEEGAGATDLVHDWDGSASDYHTWDTEIEATQGESVRCIRNIGTYDDPSEGIKDITFAPVTRLPDKYFSLKRVHNGSESDILTFEDAEDYYVFHFDRLNTKSIREFSPGELPYHDQMSLNNRVYTKMVTQPLSLDVDTYSEKNGEINNKVTQKGHNDYCPEGYRFPNHTEMLLMELYLPKTYQDRKADGTGYASRKYPTRTYYNRGYYGSLRSDTEPWSTEKGKVGWIYSSKMHCSPYNETITQSRCVRDDDQTGVISGKISVEGDILYPGDKIPVDFKFYSNASTFTHATLTLWYTNSSGYRSSWDLTSQLKQPSGLQYQNTQDITMPTLTQLGLSTTGFESANMELEVEFTNLSNRSGGDNLDVQMKNPILVELTPAEHFYPNDSQGGSFTYTISSASHNVNLSSATFKLCYTDQSDTPRERSIGTVPLAGKSHSGSYELAIPTLSELGLETLGLNLNRPMTIEATVTSTDGLTRETSSGVRLVSHLTGSSMEFPTAYDNDNGIPVNLTVESVNDRASVNSATLYWKREGDANYSAGTPLVGSPLNTYVKNIIGEDLSELNKGKFYFYFTAACTDGTSINSDVWSMDILWYGKNWNPGPWSESSTVGQINKKWDVQTISDLNFADGDFIDAYIDVTDCVYIRKDGSANNDIGMDNLISFGDANSTLLWNPQSGNIILYYPAHHPSEAPDQDLLQIGVLHYGKKTIARIRPYTLNGVLTVRLEDDLFKVNGAEPDWSNDRTGPDGKPAEQIAGDNTVERSRASVSHLTDGSTVKIGSVEGLHRSRATYKYVRVVRKETPAP